MLQSKLFISRQFLPLHEHTVEAFTETLISFLTRCMSTRTVQQVHTQMLINAIEKPNFLIPKLIDLKDMPYAYRVFSQIPHPSVYVFNFMIRGITKVWQKYDLALEFYYKMKSSGVRPDKFTYPFLFIACTNLVELDQGRSAHSSVFKSGLDTDHHVTHSLMTMYAMCSKVEDARKVFDEIPLRDSVSWNSMISGYAKRGHSRDAVELFRKMKDEEGFVPDERTVVSTLSACADLGDLSLGKWIESFVMENKMEMNTFVGSALIGMYGKCGDLLSARRIFDGMLRKDAITWNAMITGYAQSGLAYEAIRLFNLMKEAGVKPDNRTLSLVLSSCASIGALDLGKWVDTYVSQLGIKHDIYIGTALLDMYAKCGSLDDALRTFEEMPQKNEASWNAMISALASHGRAEEALTLFQHMLKEGGSICPSDITFIHILSACVHAGLVNEGRRLFGLMNSFGLVPKVQHFSCMVDLFSRAGLLYEAWDFIEKMPGKPDEITLGALHGACQKRRNTEVGERVIQLILEIEPSNSGNYVISSKLYADVNRLDDAARMRLLMREKGVVKLPGCSWIEIEGQHIEFHAGDQLHEITSGVYVLLVDEMRREGYIPNLASDFLKAVENGEM